MTESVEADDMLQEDDVEEVEEEANGPEVKIDPALNFLNSITREELTKVLFNDDLEIQSQDDEKRQLGSFSVQVSLVDEVWIMLTDNISDKNDQNDQ